MTPSTAADLPWGLSKGHPTTLRTLKPKPSNRKGKASQRKTFVKNIVREVAGHAPYERRLMELLRWVVRPQKRSQGRKGWDEGMRGKG